MGVKKAGIWSGLALLVAVAAGGAVQNATQGGSGKTIRFGDVILRDFATAELELGVVAKVRGNMTTVDAVDPDRKSRAQLKAQEITAFMSKPQNRPNVGSAERTVGRVEKIEAAGKVTFQGTRPASDGQGPVQVQAAGSKAVYDRTALQLTLFGPVTFSAEQPEPSGSGKNVVTGKADRAFYDEGKRVLQLFGNVEASVVTPDTPPEGSSFSGDEVTIDMSKQPYRISISNPSLSGVINIRVREQEKPGAPGAPKR